MGLIYGYEWKFVKFSFKPWPNDQTLLVKHFRCALQAMFDHFATPQNIVRQAEFVWQISLKTPNTFSAFGNKKMFDEQCYATWPNSKNTFLLYMQTSTVSQRMFYNSTSALEKLTNLKIEPNTHAGCIAAM